MVDPGDNSHVVTNLGEVSALSGASSRIIRGLMTLDQWEGEENETETLVWRLEVSLPLITYPFGDKLILAIAEQLFFL